MWYLPELSGLFPRLRWNKPADRFWVSVNLVVESTRTLLSATLEITAANSLPYPRVVFDEKPSIDKANCRTSNHFTISSQVDEFVVESPSTIRVQLLGLDNK